MKSEGVFFRATFYIPSGRDGSSGQVIGKKCVMLKEL
jgi:hypothetical protein